MMDGLVTLPITAQDQDETRTIVTAVSGDVDKETAPRWLVFL